MLYKSSITLPTPHRSSCLSVFFKIVFLKNFAKLTKTRLWWSSFCNKVNQYRCFPRNFAKPFSSPFSENIYGWMHLLAASSFVVLLVNIKFKSSYRSCSSRKGVLKNFTYLTGKHLCQSLFFKRGLWHRCLPVNLAKIQEHFFYTCGQLLLKILR